MCESQVYLKKCSEYLEEWGEEEVLSKTHVIATILVILDISCMFVTMATDSARNLVLPGPQPWRGHVVSIWASWCFSVSLSPPAWSWPFLSLSFLSLSLAFYFLLPGNNCLCFPACCRWRQPLPQLLLASVAETSQEGMGGWKVQELGLGLGKGSARLWAL